MRKVVSMILMLALLAVLVSGCSGGSASSSSASSQSSSAAASSSQSSSSSQAASSSQTASSSQASSSAPAADEEAPTVTILLGGDNTPNAHNMVLDALGERTNTVIEMTYVAGADVDTKISTMAAANTLPDLFGSGGTTAQEFIDAGLLFDLTDYIDQIPNWYGNAEDLIPQMPLNSTGLYVIPTGKVGYSHNLNIRTDWLDNLGLEMPTTTDELYEVFRAFTEDDPNQNGVDDTFGLACGSTPDWYMTLFGAFGIPQGSNIVLEDGTVSTWQKHPNYLEAVKYIRSLSPFVEPDWLTIPNMDMFGKLWNGVAGAMDFQCVGPTNNWYPSRYTEPVTPTFGFAVIKGPEGKHGCSPRFASLTSGYVIAATAEDHIDGVLRVADYCCTEEGNTLLYLGVEGVMFEWVDKENGEYKYLGENVDTAVQRANGGFCYHVLCSPSTDCEVRTFNKQTQEGVALFYSEMITENVVNCYDTLQTTSDYGTDMNDIMQEMWVALLDAESDDELQGIYDEYMQRWETEAHGSDWEKEITEWYNAHK